MGIVPRHQIGSAEGLVEFVNSFVYGSSRFANIHEKVFADRFYPVEAGFGGDLPEFVFVCGEWDPREPGKGGVRERYLFLDFNANRIFDF